LVNMFEVKIMKVFKYVDVIKECIKDIVVLDFVVFFIIRGNILMY